MCRRTTALEETRQAATAERLQAQERLLMRTLDERLNQVSQRVTESLHKQAVDTANTMGDLKERLAVIGKALA